MGWGEIDHWNRVGLESVYEQLDARVHPLKIELPGRKKNRNIIPFHTYIGRDAKDALKHYLNHERPDHPSGAIFIMQTDTPINYHATTNYWTRQLARLGIIVQEPKKANTNTR